MPRGERSERYGAFIIFVFRYHIRTGYAKHLLEKRQIMSDELSIERIEHKATLLLCLSGSLNVYTAQKLRNVLIEWASIVTGRNEKPSIIIDFSNLDFLDSTGMSALVGAKKRFMSFGGDVACVAGSPKIMKVFRITGLDTIFTFFDSREAALKSGT